MERSLIPDDLLRQIIAVGQVDILVGVVTHNHSRVIGDLVRAIRAGFRTYFPRRRAALIAVDQGSSDETLAGLERAWAGELGSRDAHGLRTTHCMTTSIGTATDGEGATELVLAVGDLLQATAVVVVDADAPGPTPATLSWLAGPVVAGEVDLVAPVYRRRPHEGLLVTQLMRPLIRMAFGAHLREPLLPEFGCSGRLATQCSQLSRSSSYAVRDTNAWVTVEALADGVTISQAELGPREPDPTRPAPPLTEVFPRVVGAAFAALDDHSGVWLTRASSTAIGTARGWSGDEPSHEPWPGGASLLASFEEDVRNLHEVLRSILRPDTLDALHAASARSDGPRYPDELWAQTIVEFLTAFHQGVMRRDHITRALLPLYVARSGAFLSEHGHSGPDDVERAAESLATALERRKPEMAERWSRQQEVGHG